MRRATLLLTLVGAMLLACTGVVLAQQTSPGGQQSAPGQAVRVCPGPAAPGTARCHSLLRTDIAGGKANGGGNAGGAGKVDPGAGSGTSGYWNACDLQAAYNLPLTYDSSSKSVTDGYCASSGSTKASPGSKPTVAIVDAYDDPKAESDLIYYRSYYGLGACTTANGCFKKVNQKGIQGSYPKANGGWGQEISLDLDMVSAICPDCKVLLVEANSNSWSDLMPAVDYAVNHADYISNSYGGSEFSSETSFSYDGHFNKTGKVVTASSGDNGYGVSYPAASQYVTAVGGTSLKKDGTTTRGWSETVWSGAGSGCSAYEQRPSWQANDPWSTDTSCIRRTVADVAAVADPNTGVWVYDSYSYQGRSGWMVIGGTSAASPIVASVYALAGNGGSVNYGSYPYGYAGSMWDVTSGSNGSCGGTYLCTGASGYDGPTGLGTPNGLGAF